MKQNLKALSLGLLLATSLTAVAKADGMMSASSPAASPESSCCNANWSGLYIAGSIGYGGATSEVDHDITIGAVTSSQNDDISSQSAIGSVAIGYDRQMSGVVLGVFADYTFGELDGSGTLTGPDYIEPYKINFDNTFAVGARLGFSRSCCTLWYVTAGYTGTEMDFDGSFEQDLTGYFVGGGVEQKLRDGFSLKLEYRYADYSSETLFNETTTVCGTVCTQRIEADADIHTIRIGLAYKLQREEIHAPLK